MGTCAAARTLLMSEAVGTDEAAGVVATPAPPSLAAVPEGVVVAVVGVDGTGAVVRTVGGGKTVRVPPKREALLLCGGCCWSQGQVWSLIRSILLLLAFNN